VLEATIAARRVDGVFHGLTTAEIKRGFEMLAGRYLNSAFHTTYLARPLSARGFLATEEGRFWFRPSLLTGITLSDLEGLRDDLMQSLQDATERRRASINQLDEACKLPVDQVIPRRRLVEEYLADFRGNLGENFEIISYAVLREYFAAFGFRLQRFSTTHANDGGIDYVGGDCIYQVSTDGGLDKLEGDLAKAPDIKRVIVRPELAEAARSRADDTALSTIELADLLTHFVGWLLARDMKTKRAKHLQGILEVALTEFRREDRAERG
jgi:hypothetical protein